MLSMRAHTGSCVSGISMSEGFLRLTRCQAPNGRPLAMSLLQVAAHWHITQAGREEAFVVLDDQRQLRVICTVHAQNFAM
jgi:hypothetical protein